jgi:hypothetical protein
MLIAAGHAIYAHRLEFGKQIRLRSPGHRERGQRFCSRAIMIDALGCRRRQSHKGVELVWVSRCQLAGQSRDQHANSYCAS